MTTLHKFTISNGTAHGLKLHIVATIDDAIDAAKKYGNVHAPTTVCIDLCDAEPSIPFAVLTLDWVLSNV